MLKALRVPFDKKPLNFAAEEITKLGDKRICFVAPTARNVRILAGYGLISAEFFTAKDFTTFANSASGILIPKQLRPFYLQKAAKALSKKDKLMLFKSEEGVFLEDFGAFLHVSSSMLSFYKELSSEMIDVETLAAAGKYTDYENQITVLAKLWQKYLELIKADGYHDQWEDFKHPKFRTEFIDRYDEFIFLISGYLTKYELRQLEQVSSTKNVTLIFNYAGARYSLHRMYEKYLNFELPDRSLRAFHQNDCRIIPCPGMAAQLEFITAEIFRLNKQAQVAFDDMAVIIPDETIKSYFLRIDPYNIFDVTSNENIDALPAFAFVRQIFETAWEMKSSKNNLATITKIQALLQCPTIRQHGDIDAEIEELIHKIEKGKLYITLKEVLQLPFLGEIGAEIFNADNFITPWQTISLMRKIFNDISTREPNNKPIFAKIVSKLDELGAYYLKISETIPFAESAKLILNELASIKIATAKGKVAVMGVLESRNLNYKILFLPAMNEDKFPPASSKDLFLNTEIRKELGLPTFTDRENLTKNYLLQIMEKADLTTILYTKSSSSIRRSRWAEELSVRNHIPEFVFMPTPLHLISSPEKHFPYKGTQTIEKDDNIIAALRRLTFSATSFNNYLACPLQFYFKYVDKTYPQPSPETTLSDRAIGNAFHKSIENTSNQKIDPTCKNFAENLKVEYQNALQAFDAYKFNTTERFRGDAAGDEIEIIAKAELERLNNGYITIYREKKLEVNFEGYNLKGKIDRIDEKAGEFDIIDYKFRNAGSGQTNINFQTATDLQMPFYALLFENTFKQPPANLYYFNLKSDFGLTEAFPMEQYDQFKEFAKTKLDEILSPTLPFFQTEKQEPCRYCPYSKICGRKD